MLYSVLSLSFISGEVGVAQNSCNTTVEHFCKEIEIVPQEACLQLALACLKDQNQEKAIQEFLRTLETVAPKAVPSVTDQEKELYEKGYRIYLDRSFDHTPKDTAIKLYQEFKQTTDEHKDYYLLNLLMSTAYANLNRYEEFFNAFYRSYPYYSDHYLSYKTKAALHIRLFEKARQLSEREEERKLVFANTLSAIEKNPFDIGLYKIAMLFAGENHVKVVKDLLTEISQKNIVVPRHDIVFFVHQAITSNQIDAAQKFVDKSREWYHYSRSISEAQEHLDQHLDQHR
jgi:hypothetical protein